MRHRCAAGPLEMDELGQDLVLHHVGIGTRRFEQAIDAYLSLGYALRVSVDDELLGVRVAFVEALAGGLLIEIVAPLGDNSPLKAFIARKQFPSAYHTCYAVSDLIGLEEPLRQRGFMPLAEPRRAKALQGALIQYYLHQSIGLVEFVESADDLDSQPAT